MAIATFPSADPASHRPSDGTFRLARFVSLLMLDDYRLQAFLTDPEDEMMAAGLSEEERALLRTEGIRNLCDYFWEAQQAPAPHGQGSDGGTGGGGG